MQRLEVRCRTCCNLFSNGQLWLDQVYFIAPGSKYELFRVPILAETSLVCRYCEMGPEFIKRFGFMLFLPNQRIWWIFHTPREFSLSKSLVQRTDGVRQL
jgi:hypothetical protein